MVLLKFSVTIYPVYFRFLLCYNGQDERQKYGVIEDSNKKAERFYSPGNVPRVYSSFDNNPEIFVRKEIYAPKLFIVRVRTVHLWRRERDSNPCASFLTTAFRVRLVMTSSISLQSDYVGEMPNVCNIQHFAGFGNHIAAILQKSFNSDSRKK